jgi:TldD protein
MKSLVKVMLFWVSFPAFSALPELVEVLDIEINRAIEDLDLDGEGPPWRVRLDLGEMISVDVSAEMGGLLTEKVITPSMPFRFLNTEVRQGTSLYDSGDFSDGSTGSYERLPSDLSPAYLQRKAWMQIDEAYKSAVTGFTRKRSVLPADKVDRPAVAPVKLPDSLSDSALPDLDARWIRETTLALSAVLSEYPSLEAGKSVGSQAALRRVSLSSEGLRLSRVDTEIVFRVQGKVRADDGSLLENSRSWIARKPNELPTVQVMLSQVHEMAQELVERSSARILDDYIGPVLFEQPASVEFFGQLLLPEILGTPPAVESPYGATDEPAQAPRTARIGRRLLPSGWSIVDDAREEGPGHYKWDSDGVSPSRVLIVQDGVLRQPLMSRVPVSAESRSTGHGLSGTGRHLAMPGRIKISPDKVLSSGRLEKKALRAAKVLGRDSVLVVSRLQAMVSSPNMSRGRGRGETAPGLSAPTEAYLLYKDGRREPVRCASFLGVDRRALRDVIAAGQVGPTLGRLDQHPSKSRYGRGWTRGVQSGWATPAVLISELELVSQVGGSPRLLPRLESLSE